MNAYVDAVGACSARSRSIANHLNIPKPPAGEPTLLTCDEVTTMFHEFGHALHGMFSDVNYPHFAGTSVPRDFVEYPVAGQRDVARLARGAARTTRSTTRPASRCRRSCSTR